jgi:hypothetical protein
MFANLPPLGLFQVHTFGGTYSDELAMAYTCVSSTVPVDCDTRVSGLAR